MLHTQAVICVSNKASLFIYLFIHSSIHSFIYLYSSTLFDSKAREGEVDVMNWLPQTVTALHTYKLYVRNVSDTEVGMEMEGMQVSAIHSPGNPTSISLEQKD